MTDDPAQAAPPALDEPLARFYRGRIVKLQHGRGRGLVRSAGGREIPFVHPFVELLDGRKMGDLSEGMEVGFDVGWTSKGLRVTKLKID